MKHRSERSHRRFRRRQRGASLLEAADLIAGSGSVLDPVSGFDRGRRDNAFSAMRAAFRVWFGSRITDDFLSSKLTNQVYMPRTVKQDTAP